MDTKWGMIEINLNLGRRFVFFNFIDGGEFYNKLSFFIIDLYIRLF